MKKLPRKKLGLLQLEALIILFDNRDEPLTNKEVAEIMKETQQNTWRRLRGLWHSRLIMKHPDKTYTLSSRGLNAIVERIFSV